MNPDKRLCSKIYDKTKSELLIWTQTSGGTITITSSISGDPIIPTVYSSQNITLFYFEASEIDVPNNITYDFTLKYLKYFVPQDASNSSNVNLAIKKNSAEFKYINNEDILLLLWGHLVETLGGGQNIIDYLETL